MTPQLLFSFQLLYDQQQQGAPTLFVLRRCVDRRPSAYINNCPNYLYTWASPISLLLRLKILRRTQTQEQKTRSRAPSLLSWGQPGFNQLGSATFIYLNISVATVYSSNMKGQNQCAWLTIGRTVPCGKRCIYEHCAVHRNQLRKDAVEPYACRKCGKGTQSETRLCVGCGSDRVKHKLIDTEKQVRRKFATVLIQLRGLKFSFKD